MHAYILTYIHTRIHASMHACHTYVHTFMPYIHTYVHSRVSPHVQRPNDLNDHCQCCSAERGQSWEESIQEAQGMSMQGGKRAPKGSLTIAAASLSPTVGVAGRKEILVSHEQGSTLAILCAWVGDCDTAKYHLLHLCVVITLCHRIQILCLCSDTVDVCVCASE